VRKKQIYGQAFALYALSEYARCPAAPEAERAEARRLAAATYELLEANARDRVAGGYREALAEDWRPTADRVLSPVDLDCAKSMNTNLHVLEALANYFRLDPTPRAREAIESLLAVHAERIRQADGHLGLFFNDDWSRLDAKVSYGHDIEASWLMDEAAEAIGAAGRPGPEAAAVAALAASALAEGYDPVSGGLDDEAESSAPGARRSSVRIWWCQAEALVGFLGAWQRTGDSRYLAAARGVRGFIEERIRDRRGGDWRWGVDAAGAPLAGRPKGGNWKTGYHNGRCCMEIRRRTAPYLIGGSL
jgi:mannobiose 2-epimerase